MSKVKYIKVLTADRLPEKDGEYYTEQGLLSFSKGSFWQYEGRAFVKSNNGVDNWLKPVPDKEEEMREMLEELVTHHFDFMGCGEIKELQKKAEQLLSELQNKP